MRHFNLVEHQVAIVDAVVAELSTHISDSDAREGLVRLHVSDLDHEWLDTIIIAERDTARKNDSVIRLNAKSSRPELGSLDGR